MSAVNDDMGYLASLLQGVEPRTDRRAAEQDRRSSEPIHISKILPAVMANIAARCTRAANDT